MTQYHGKCILIFILSLYLSYTHYPWLDHESTYMYPTSTLTSRKKYF